MPKADDNNNTNSAAGNQQPMGQDSTAAQQQQYEDNDIVQLTAAGNYPQQAVSNCTGVGINQTHYSTTDPDARVSVKPGKPIQLNYLAQLSVDTASHVITNIETHTADHRDSECLASVVSKTVANLQPHGLQVEEVLADTNYSSGSALKYLEQHNITGYIPNFGGYKAQREGFTYDKEQDRYTCSRGVHLPFKGIQTTPEGYQKKRYRSSAGDCASCPVRAECLGKANCKQLADSVDKPCYERMHQRMQTASAKRMIRRRGATVEPVIGTLVNYLGIKRVNTRGLELANKCMVMAAVAYNLKKLLKHQSHCRATGGNALKAKGKKKPFSAPLLPLVNHFTTKMAQKLQTCLSTYNRCYKAAYQKKSALSINII